MSDALTLSFVSGTLEIRGPSAQDLTSLINGRWDPRTASLRVSAHEYANVVRALHREKRPFTDEARRYTELDHGLEVCREPRPFQSEALTAWSRHQGRGVVVLPTGAGKSHVALMAIDQKQRSALIVAPTLDLVRQWYDLLRTSFHTEIGVIGGGDYKVCPLTVTTYDSAYLHMEHIGARFGMLIFDECHHLPSESYALAARFSIAPFRLGLTATPERADGKTTDLIELIGPTVYRRDVVELSGHYLADYETQRVYIRFSPEEREKYEEARGTYKRFIVSNGIQMSSPQGWSKFVWLSSQSAKGREAMVAYQRQRHLAFAAPAKLDYVEELLFVHRTDRVLIFTQDNATAYEISTRFLVPAITHQTKVTERSEILSRFSSGEYGVIVTSKVLNEGVDVPDANVAIVVSGSGSVREHVQRLGRILRKREGKRALLYELVTVDTTETFTSDRRREHVAYH